MANLSVNVNKIALLRNARGSEVHPFLRIKVLNNG